MLIPKKIEKVYPEEYMEVPKMLFTQYLMGVVSDRSHGH
jgi:hypothetical protein